MIYSHKSQRSGRSISANINNPPQDPPKINVVTEPIISDTIIPKIPETVVVPTVTPEIVIPDILIEDTTPPVPEICIEKELELPKPVSPQAEVTLKISLFRRFIAKIKSFFGRN